MTGLIAGFRETLEAAVIIVLILAAVRRLGHGHLAQLVWYGLGAGVLVGLSVATGLASVRVGVGNETFVTLQQVTVVLSLLVLSGLAVWMRQRSEPQAASADDAAEAAGAWLVIAAAFLAALPQSLELVVRLAGVVSQAGLPGMAAVVAGVAGAVALAGVLYMGLLHCHPAHFFRPASRRELAPVAQESDAHRG